MLEQKFLPLEVIPPTGMDEASRTAFGAVGALVLARVSGAEAISSLQPQNRVENLIEEEFSDPSLWSVRRDTTGGGVIGVKTKREVNKPAEKVVFDPSRLWVANIYGSRVVPAGTIDNPEAIEVESASLETVTAIHNRLNEGVLKGENMRIATLVTSPYPKDDAHPDNVDLWLEEIHDGRWTIMLFAGATYFGKVAQLLPFNHDYTDYHLGNMALFPREVQDLTTEATAHEIKWREMFHASRVPEKFMLLDGEKATDIDKWALRGQRGSMSLSGVDRLDDVSDISNYMELLAYIVTNPEVSCKERLHYLLSYDPAAYKYGHDERNDALIGIQQMRAGIGDLVNFNSRHREGKNTTQELVDSEYNKFLVGLVRVAQKIRGERLP